MAERPVAAGDPEGPATGCGWQRGFRPRRGEVPFKHEVLFLLGSGNNAGDGYLAAQYLYGLGLPQTTFRCVTLASPSQLVGEAARACAEWSHLAGAPESWATFAQTASRPCLIVDALCGTGLRDSLAGEWAEAVTWANEASRELNIPLLAIDSPSGYDERSGAPGEPCIQATHTLLMGLPRWAAFLGAGPDYFGEVTLADLGYRREFVESVLAAVTPKYLISTKTVVGYLPPRARTGAKWDHGQVAILGGSAHQAGAPAFAARAAYRTGCGYVRLAAPAGARQALQTLLPEAVLYPQGGPDRSTLLPEDLDPLVALCERADGWLLGPGLGSDTDPRKLVLQLLPHLTRPGILDADALNALASLGRDRAIAFLAGHGAPLLLTPHEREWERLFGPLPPHPTDRLAELARTAIACRQTLLLKGTPTLIAHPNGAVELYDYRFAQNAEIPRREGCAEGSILAKAGTGDVLSGILLGLLGQCPKECPLPAQAPFMKIAALGAWLHGRAAHHAARELTPYGLLASELADRIPRALKDLLEP